MAMATVVVRLNGHCGVRSYVHMTLHLYRATSSNTYIATSHKKSRQNRNHQPIPPFPLTIVQIQINYENTLDGCLVTYIYMKASTT